MENSSDQMRHLMGAMSAGGMGIDAPEDFDRPKVYYICGGKRKHNWLYRVRQGATTGVAGYQMLLLRTPHLLQETRTQAAAVRGPLKFN